jgi:hypothetical protein
VISRDDPGNEEHGIGVSHCSHNELILEGVFVNRAGVVITCIICLGTDPRIIELYTEMELGF